MKKSPGLALLGVVVAIGITTTMDATGLLSFSALPLAPLFGLFAWRQHLSRRELGISVGRGAYHGLALIYPLLVMGVIAALAAFSGAIDVSHADPRKASLNLFLVAVTTVIVAFVTEEGFFRGWLWASLRRSGLSAGPTLIWTSLAFAAWHISAVTFDTGFRPEPWQVPVFLLNALTLGAIWGMLRLLSGSILVSSVSHGLWNGLAYVLFGFGKHDGTLGIKNTGVFGPEVGLLGLGLNLSFAAALWWGMARAAGKVPLLKE